MVQRELSAYICATTGAYSTWVDSWFEVQLSRTQCCTCLSCSYCLVSSLGPIGADAVQEPAVRGTWTFIIQAIPTLYHSAQAVSTQRQYSAQAGYWTAF